MNDDEIYVKLKWRDREVELMGSPEDVIREVEKFVLKYIPTISLAEKLSVSIDARDLAEILSPFIKISGVEVVLSDEISNKASQSDKVLLVLAARKLMYLLGRVDSDYMALDEVSGLVGSSNKSTSSRLSELYSQRLVDRRRSGNKVFYRITVGGILRLKKRIEDALRGKDYYY